MARNNNRVLVPEAKAALENMKMEAARSLNVGLKQGYNGDLTARQNGSVGGEMVKRLISQVEGTMGK